MDIDLTLLYEAQAKLDQRIHQDHGLNYDTTRNKRILALLVEIGEFANETRCFKYWSRKGPSANEVILDELADGMHFYLSIGIDLGANNKKMQINDNNLSLSEQFLRVYDTIMALTNEYCLSNYYQSFQDFLILGLKLKFTSEEIIDSYYQKLNINYERQNQAY